MIKIKMLWYLMLKFSKLSEFANIKVLMCVIFIIIMIIRDINEEKEKSVEKINKSWNFYFNELLKTCEIISLLNYD